jgi:hypothetical protein
MYCRIPFFILKLGGDSILKGCSYYDMEIWVKGGSDMIL